MKTEADAFQRILEILDRLEIPYQVVGSLACSVHGIPRTTFDIDLVVNLRADQIEDFAAQLQRDFYADADTMRETLARGRAFNVVHYATSYKFDIFPLQPDEYSQTQFGRREFAETRLFEVPIECAFATAEDTILNKLRWYRAGGETSERQWNDLRGIVQVSGDRLNLDYLNHWAKELNVADLLKRLLSEQPPKHD